MQKTGLTLLQLFSAGDNGSLWFWDWKSGHNYQQAQTIVQPGKWRQCNLFVCFFIFSGQRRVVTLFYPSQVHWIVKRASMLFHMI